MLKWIKSFFKSKKPGAAPKPGILKPAPVEMPELPTPGSASKLVLGIIVGHEAKAPGARVATPINSNEYFINKEVAEAIRKEALAHGIECYVILRDKIGIVGAYAKAISLKCDAVIELHFNAANTVAFGTETLCTKSGDDRAFAQFVQKHMVRCFGRQGKGDRGVKALTVSDRGGFSVHSFPGGVNCLVEPFFSDNPREVELYLKVKDEYPRALVQAVRDWAKSIGVAI